MLGLLNPLKWPVWPAMWACLSALTARIRLLFSRPSPPVGSITLKNILCIDVEDDEASYRVRKRSRVVYVYLLGPDIIPRDFQYGYMLWESLQKLPKWDEEWTSLTVRKTPHGIESTLDETHPHGLDLKQLDIPDSMAFIEHSDLTILTGIGERLFRVLCGGESLLLKVAPFPFELRYLTTEVSTYMKLAASGFPLAPKFYGLVYEGTRDRVTGFLMEIIRGRYPTMEDLGECEEALHMLHEYGFIHKDINKFNFLVTDHGVRILDFETAVLKSDADPGAADAEMKSLPTIIQEQLTFRGPWEFC
ncbi:hypothetical protein LOZ12_004258 [Ophidiomyces ophidiicola]|uniref:Uncharacterized protein n=1 Tax=Ophidiomyces ophidiicola TaxID=1387563 RepID=A0ACB8UTM6_9EURO|nr:hypothetical protein LOZ62_004270 [Ophidiomyces ophidiicola]KAI1970354.1 hypothetical protein LOZ56_003733 [Ophidiomyces ophidiicola]KAI2004033.1 hypothetical protein LOZ50_004478 [Ophidiomyces ophidiicola]KAI2037373.1 hypothetical protein LOZ47_003781 [Ophidiomyces ophidiicola]KAI2046932.1 hypothetical protein LOZ44_004293 [Ophidiomyces ophidiicola]